MFVLNRERVVKWPVDVPLGEDDGKRSLHRYTARFKMIDDADVRRLVDADPLNMTLLRAVLVGWEDVADKESPLPFSAVTLERVLQASPTFRHATIQAFFDCHLGVAAKNVVTPPASGLAAMPTETAASSSPKT